jgi:ketosteroid isomerase-like protein
MAEAIQIVRDAWKAWEAGDLETALGSLDDEVEWHRAGDEPEVETLRGPAAVAAMMGEWFNSFDQFRVEALEFIDGGKCVVVPLRYSGRLPGSGAEVAIEETNVFWVRDGKVVEVREYRTKPEALEAAGLSR